MGQTGEGRWKWWGWYSELMNSEEVQRVHMLLRNAVGGGKLFSVDLVLSKYTQRGLLP